MINRFILSVILLTTCYNINACKCAHQTVAEEWKYADQVFVGIPVRKEMKDLVTYFFLVQENLKGKATDSIVIQTGIGGGDCGMNFETGVSYLVYASNGKTNRCRRNALSANNPDLNRIRFLADSTYALKIADDNSPFLTAGQAFYLNTELAAVRKSFDFSGKKIAFLYNNTLIGKQAYFREQGGRDVAYQLVIFNENEQQQSNGFHAIVVFWRKLAVSAKQKKRLISELATKGYK